jgi:hypothetical protein
LDGSFSQENIKKHKIRNIKRNKIIIGEKSNKNFDIVGINNGNHIVKRTDRNE